MTPTEQDKELQNWLVEHTALIEETGGAVWRELEVETFMYHLRALITADRKRVALEARIAENKRWLTALAPSMDENVAYNSDFHSRIAELKAQQEEV